MRRLTTSIKTIVYLLRLASWLTLDIMGKQAMQR